MNNLVTVWFLWLLGFLGTFFMYGVIVLGYIIIVNIPDKFKQVVKYLKGGVEATFNTDK